MIVPEVGELLPAAPTFDSERGRLRRNSSLVGSVVPVAIL